MAASTAAAAAAAAAAATAAAAIPELVAPSFCFGAGEQSRFEMDGFYLAPCFLSSAGLGFLQQLILFGVV